MPPVDHFPSTHATWIDAQLTLAEDGDAARSSNARQELRRYLMERYHAPLRAYVRGGSLRRVADPDELVAGFFADRASEPDFLTKWRGANMPLRRWMMNGVAFYARGVMRDRGRDRLRTFTDAPGAGGGAGGDSTGDDGWGGLSAADRLVDDRTAEQAFERAWAIAVLDAAHAQAHAELAAEGRLDDYEIFRRRVIDGEGYETIAPLIGRTPQQCAGATRLVSQRMRAALLDVLRAEGVREGELEATVNEVHRGVRNPE